MNKYETIIIINPDIESDETESIIEGVQNLISSNSGEISKLDRWGKRRLAYEVKGNREGYYLLIDYEAPSDFVSELSRYCGVNELIIKYMTVRAEDIPEPRQKIEKKDEDEDESLYRDFDSDDRDDFDDENDDD